MQHNLHNTKIPLYSIGFACAFWLLLLIPLFAPNITLDTLPERFNGRKQLIQIFNTFRLRIGDKVFARAIIGKENWIYLVEGETIQDYQKVPTWQMARLKALQKKLDKITAQFEARGAIFLVVIAPNKSTIYPEYMPPELNVIGNTSNIDMFMDYMEKHGKTRVLDLRPALLKASQEDQVFFKTDSHWNYMGAYVAYREVIEYLSTKYPQLQPLPLSSFFLYDAGLVTRDMSNSLGFIGVREKTITISPPSNKSIQVLEIPTVYSRRFRFASNPASQPLKVLIYHDSFFLPVVPLLETGFSQTISIQPDPGVRRPGINSYWGLGWIDQQHPDIVIYEVVERGLTRMDRLIDTWSETQSK